MHTNTIAILGAGNMGSSLLLGLIASQHPAKQLWIADPDADKLRLLQQQCHVHTTIHNEEAVQNADTVILAVKPQVMNRVVQALASIVQQKKPLVISIAAGIREECLQKGLGQNIAIVRCMPNTPALIRAGASALYANRFVNEKQHALAESILRAVGIVVWVKKEEEMDAVTALSGSGPAYFFLIIDALQKAGEKLGLSHETARLLALQTAFGAAKMALESDESVDELRRRVTSPGGTTEAAIGVLQKENIEEIFVKALDAAYSRSKELAELFSKEN